MGFQGQLNSVSLTDIFQTLSMNRQTGTLIVPGADGPVHIWFDQGQIARCSAVAVGGRPRLIHALHHRNLLTQSQADGLFEQFRNIRQGLRDLITATGLVSDPDLDEISAWCAEEIVCPAFELQQGDFQFIDGPPSNEVMAYDAIDLGPAPLATPQLIMEATRRLDEWQRIREVIPKADAYFVVDNEGRANLRNLDSDPDMLKVLRYLDGRHSLENIAEQSGISRFDIHAILAQLVLAQVARSRTPQEAVADAATLRKNGDPRTARELLENTLGQFNVPEVLRPLAELCAELKDTPRAVELYLDLIQRAQDSGDLEQALADLDTILTLSPNDPDLHFDRAQTLGELNRYDDAAAAYIQAAQQYLSLRRIDQAADACHRAKNLVPRSADPHRYLAKAYLLEGQTENAIVEYKSLWHALLSDQRPRKALENLRTLLEQDCKFPAVKEQVLAHAQSSEAVKTGNAVRMLIYAMVGIVLVASLFIGWKIIEKEVIKKGATDGLQEIKTEMSTELAQLKHQELSARLLDLSQRYSSHPDIVAEADAQLATIRADAETRAKNELGIAHALIASGKLAEATRSVQNLLAHFGETTVAIEAKQLLVDIAQRKEDLIWMSQIEVADRHWQAEAWDQALAVVHELKTKEPIPPTIRTALGQRESAWTTSMGSAQDLYRRAERLENLGRKTEAMAGYLRAANADGESYRARAKERLVAVETGFADELVVRMDEAFARGDDETAFTALAQLRILGKQATSEAVRNRVAATTLPFRLAVDSRHADVAIRRPGSADQIIKPPAGTKGPWQHQVHYGLDQEVTVVVRRPGFTSETVRITADGKHSRQEIRLRRGPLWQTDLQAIPTTNPVASGTAILLGTSRSTLEIIDGNLGGARPVNFPDSVSPVVSTPFVFKKQAFLILDDRVQCVDIDTRTVQWTWPTSQDLEQPQLAPQGLWVQEHELIQGRIQIFAGTQSGRLVSLGAAGTSVTAYPSVALDGNGLTGSPAVVRERLTSTLYVPAGPKILTFDATSASERSAPRPLYSLNTRSEVIGRPVAALVAKQPGVLITDASGVVVALSADPTSTTRTLGSWSLEGTPAAGAVPHPDGTVAYVAVNEGRVILLDLAVPGRLIGRFPAQGSLGYLPAAPVIGRNGIYVADANGILSCIHPHTGELQWKADLGSPVANGILALNGRIFIPTRGGSLLCFEEGDLD